MIASQLITRSDYSQWDQYVSESDQGGPYLTTAWKNAVESAYGHQAFYLAARNGHNEIVGALPLVRVRLPMARGALVSMPYCDYGGLIADDAEAAEMLLGKAMELAGALKAGLEIRNPAHSDTIEAADGFCQVTDKCRMVLDLPESSAALWAGFKSKLRSQVKRAGKEGLVARLGQSEMIGDFYHVFSRNMRDIGSPVHSFQWLENILHAFGENARVGMVYRQKLPIGAGIILMHGRTVTVPWASTVKEFNRFSPNMLLYWKFLEFAADGGYSSFDFGRSTPGEGTYAFKRQWGASPVPLSWYRRCGNGNQKNTDASAGQIRDAMEKLWQRLPLRAANTLGPHLRKYITR